jgi:hypothetical protein
MLINTTAFFYNYDDNRFSQEASSLRIIVPAKTIELKSAKTGDIVKFIQQSVLSDFNTGDIHEWVYAPSPEAIKINPKLNGCTLVIFND